MNHWLDTAVFYEIYPQSFQDSNADGIGDIQGIIKRLDYIKDLGCDAIWLNPCFLSPFNDAGYDVADYYTVAPRYGTNEDLKHLFDEAHSRNMHVLLDLVPGHTSIEHYWFKESMKAEKNEFTSRYIWTDDIWKPVEGLNTLRGISNRNGSCILNFFSSQPALNYGFYHATESWQDAADSPAAQRTREAIKDIMRFWLKAGCDGFRVDMAGTLVKNDPESLGTIALWKNIRGFLDEEFPDAVMVSEWGEPDKSLEAGFHMDFLLHFGPSHYNDLFRCEHPFFSSAGEGDVAAFVEKYKENRAKAARGLICIPSGNHDMKRLAWKLSQEEMKIAFAFLLSMPGAPFIYYGDEIGMRYIDNLESVEGGYERTGARTPMQWDDGVNAGFSSASPRALYIAQDAAKDRPTVAYQQHDMHSLLNEVKKLIGIRREHPALGNTSQIEFVYAEKNAYPLAYLRKCPEEEMLVVLNPSAEPVEFDGATALGRGVEYSLCHSVGGNGSSGNVRAGIVSAPPQSAAFFRAHPNT